ncbi:MAG: beta-N-acetylglucosaminidase, partial [Arenibacter latericius]|nr:beta-N-acetylglucosaminidase [Arenibacter latericius]
MRITSFIFLFFISLLTVYGQGNPLVTRDSLQQRAWVEATYQKMTLDEKLGQLFMIMVHSDQGKASAERTKKLIRDHHLGGIIFSTGGPVRQAHLTNEFQKNSKIP